MKKLYTAFLSFIFISALVKAQPYSNDYNNEWIVFSTNQPYSLQKYLKIQVWQEGIHRLSFSDITQLLPGIDTINPQNFQIFHEGKEQYIYVAGESNNVFDSTDYIEFYGKPNDGSFDTQMYDSAYYQVNPYYSLFNDTAAYFFTYGFLTSDKRMIIDIDSTFSNFNAANYVMKDAVESYHAVYEDATSGYDLNASYTNGEGWTGNFFYGTTTLSVPVPNVYTGLNPVATASTYFIGDNNPGATRFWTISVNNSTLQSISFYDYSVFKIEGQISSNSILSNGSADFKFNQDIAVANDKNTVSYIRIIYPHKLDFAGETSSLQKFTVPADLALSKTRLDIINFLPGNSATRWLYLFSGDTIIHKVNVDTNGTLYQTLAPTFGSDKLCVLTTEASTISSGGFSIAPVSVDPDPARYAKFNNFSYNNNGLIQYDYLMVSHKSLRGPGLVDPVKDYKDFRNLPEGGAYTVLLADIDELYDQFAWGINKHPLSIRNFVRFALDTFPTLPNPKYLFLVGKSIHADKARTNLSNYALNLVPTYGHPASDQIIVSRIHDNIFHPEIAVGRLSARTPQDVQMYLDKVKDHDEWLSQPPEEWMKQILHFGGGRNAQEQDIIKQHLGTYEYSIEDTLFAGNVITFLKTSTDPIQINLSQYLQNLIDSGVTLMTFFSHAAGSTFDIATDAPANYNNPKKYPVVFANSCFIGDIHDPSRLASEDFIFQPNKGAIGFIASPNTGYINDQFAYGEPFYKQIASYSYGEGIGDCMKKCIDSVNISEPLLKSVTMGMTLHGDPAIKLYPQGKPDLAVSPPSVFFTPNEVTIDLSSFDINVVIKNLGRAINQDYLVRITRRFEDGVTTKVFETTLTAMPFVDTLTVTIPMDFIYAAGFNTFDVEVDAGFPPVDESDESNNNVTAVLNIKSSDIIPVYPAKYSIVPNANINLKAVTSNLFASAKPYRFEIDTTDRFNSSALQINVITSRGGIVQWQLPFSLDSNKVYYWRTANDSITSADTAISNRFQWNESSFIHIPGKTGWSQAHYSQFKEDDFKNVVYRDTAPPVDTTFTFVKTASKIKCINNLSGYPIEFYVDNKLIDYATCGDQIHLAVFDPVSLEPWNTGNHYLGNYNTFNDSCQAGASCGGSICSGRPRPDNYFTFKINNPTALTNLKIAIEDSVPIGNYMLIYTSPTPHYEQWGDSLLKTFQDLGSQYVTLIDTPQWWQPYILITKKGDASFTVDTLGDSTITHIELEAIIGGNWDKGYVTSVPIGPAAQWTQLHWNHYNMPSSVQDSILLDVIGIDTNGTETVIIDDLAPMYADSMLDHISATDYPYLKLKAYLQDLVDKIPPQLDRWQIYYEEVPEGALNPNRHLSPDPLIGSIQEGDNYNFSIAFENINNKNFSDSMLVDFFVLDANHTRVNISSPKYKILNAGDYLVASVSFNTRNYPGLNVLWIEVNPHEDQPEQYHFNNLASVGFNVNKDITNPILDVTFDGQHILDGDIVSAKPFILVKLKDENKFLALNDTGKYRVLITDPAGKTTQPYFETAPDQSTDRSKLKWSPAALPDNSFMIEYNPVLSVDGIYFLDVQAYDESGNISGSNSYKISFEVINRSTITEFVNYPNPFSTSTRFVFTLTGSEIPQQLLIQIMTVSGKMVREITQDEIGSLHIGRNITQYTWDGKDKYGDQLANGIYFYRVQTRLNNQSIEHRDTEADKFFKKGFGKMYLLR